MLPGVSGNPNFFLILAAVGLSTRSTSNINFSHVTGLELLLTNISDASSRTVS